MNELNKFSTLKVADGVNFNYYLDNRFKQNRISINLILPLDKQSVSYNSLVINILKNGYNGCSEYSAIFKQLEMLYGASLTAGVEKRADYQVLYIAASGIDNRFVLNNENITKELSKLLSNILLKPLIENDGFREKYIELEKSQLVDQIQSEINDKRIYALNSTLKIMNGDSIGGINKYGTVEQVKATTNDDLINSYKNIIKSSKIQIMFFGSGDYKIAYDTFKEAFFDFNNENSFSIALNPIEKSDTIKEKTEIMAVNQAKMVMGFTTGLKYDDELIPALKVMVAMFGATPFSKLFVNVREKLSLCYYCAARFDKFKGIMLVDAGVEFSNITKAHDEILNQLKLIQNGEFIKTDMDYAILSIKNSLNTVYDSVSTLEAFYLSSLFQTKISSPKEELALLDTVTKEQIIKAANCFNLDTVYILKGENND